MRTLLLIGISLFILTGCELISDIIDDENECPPPSALYGLSNFDNAFHFVTVNGQDGELKVLTKLSQIPSVRGQATINPDLNHYYVTSEDRFWIIDIYTGNVIKSFVLEYPNTGNMQYNVNTKKVNALTYFSGRFHFSEIDIDQESIELISLLNIKGLNDHSGSIDPKNNKFYLMSMSTIHVLDSRDGSQIDSLVLDQNIGGLFVVEKDRLVGLNLSSMHFAEVDLKNNIITDLHACETTLTGMASLDVKAGLHYHFSGTSKLLRIDTRTGKTTATHTLPYNTNYLLPL